MSMGKTRFMTVVGLAASLLAVIPFPIKAETPAEEATKSAGEGRYADAVQKFEEAIRGEPKNASLHLGLGLAYQSLRKYPEAFQALEKAARLGPDSLEAHYSLGLLCDPSIVRESKSDVVERRYWRKALEAWEKVIGLGKDPKRVDVAREHRERIKEMLR
jgi:tetratricopeptide (TPR) repeat protein